MTLPGPKRLILSMSKEIAEENRDDLLVLLEGEPLPESDETGVVRVDFVGRDYALAEVLGRIIATPGVLVTPVY